MKRGFILCISVLMLLMVVSFVAAQEISEKQELAIFSLSHYRWQIPGGALALVDEQMKAVFVNLGRFNVVGMTYRLDGDGVDEFIRKIREVKEQNVELPETVRLGQEAFTEADFNKLINSFIVVVPVMTKYGLERGENGEFSSKIEVSFSFINVETAEGFGYFTVEVEGKADSGRQAVEQAAEKISPQLTFELRKIPEFQLKSGIINVQGRQIYLEFGANMGVAVGDEYAIVADTVLPTGHIISEETGLLIVDDVKDELSIATLVYSETKPQIGDQLEEIPRFGFDTGVHIRSVLAAEKLVGMIGIRQSISRGFLTYRPVIGIDVPFSVLGTTNLPGLVVNVYGGGEINWYLWRFQVVPTAALGVGGSVPLDEGESFKVSHAGGFIELLVSYLLNRDIKLSAAVGYTGWFRLSTDSGDTYMGPHFGIGATYKY
ncbi:MAG: hypothetical protein HN368_05980 [Spirochaetales bacterium]|jgi:hypothetical protein|nr:hypothetical protein [Spirochaetales bacterium]